MSKKPESKNAQAKSKGLDVQKMTMLALLVAAALMIYAIESMLPTLVPIPGIKLGLANVVTLITLKRYGARDAFLVLLARILLSSFFFGQLLSLLYSFCGGLLCMLVTWLVNSFISPAFSALCRTTRRSSLSPSSSRKWQASLATCRSS